MKTRLLYDNSIELIFKPSNHRYEAKYLDQRVTVYPIGVTGIIDKMIGKDLSGWAVSEVLKCLGGELKYEDDYVWYLDKPVTVDEELLRYASKAHTRRSDYGKSFGTSAHEAIGELLDGQDAFCTEEALEAVLGFIKWFNSLKDVNILASEQISYSKDMKIAGTYDLVLEIGEDIVLVDIKTTNVSQQAPKGVYASNFVQLGAYSLLLNEADNIVVDKAMIVATHKDGTVDTISTEDLGIEVSDCEEAFNDILNAYEFIDPISKRLKELKNGKV